MYWCCINRATWAPACVQAVLIKTETFSSPQIVTISGPDLLSVLAHSRRSAFGRDYGVLPKCRLRKPAIISASSA